MEAPGRHDDWRLMSSDLPSPPAQVCALWLEVILSGVDLGYFWCLCRDERVGFGSPKLRQAGDSFSSPCDRG